MSEIPTYVVIPMKDRMDLTRPLLGQLFRQREYARVFVFDNGSDEGTKEKLRVVPPSIEVFNAEGWNLHQMWNAGIEKARRVSDQSNIAILNNDIRIGPRFLSGLVRGLGSNPLLAAVSPNYDGRYGRGIQYADDLCSGRYDGTGGLAGFAFMIRGGLEYRFPEELQWWCGDRDLLYHIQQSDKRVGIVLDTTCEHIGGGGQTGDWGNSDMFPIIQRDQEWFEAKWGANAPRGV